MSTNPNDDRSLAVRAAEVIGTVSRADTGEAIGTVSRDYQLVAAEPAPLAMVEHTARPYAEFFDACETEMIDNQPIAHMESIGGRWYVFSGRNLDGYVVAGEGNSGASSLFRTDRAYPVTFWTTPPELTHNRDIGDDDRQLEAWDLAVAFITAKVHAELAHEWTDAPFPA